jgi:hypothetical protein
VRVAHARVLVAEGEALAAVARVLQISRQAVYRRLRPRRSPQRRPVTDPVDVAIVETAKSYPSGVSSIPWITSIFCTIGILTSAATASSPKSGSSGGLSLK